MIQRLINRIRRWRVKPIKPFGRCPAGDLRLSLGDLREDVAHALARAFADVPSVEVVAGNLLDLDCEAIVSPANSFGDMGGGIDRAIDLFHQGTAQPRVMEAIAHEFLGELPVGMATIVKFPSARFHSIVVAPTMRVPGRVDGTIHAYLAMRAALVAVLKHNQQGDPRIASLAVPGLATGVGGLGYQDAAEQMRAAYENIILGRWQSIRHAAQAPYALSYPQRREDAP